MPTPTTRAFEQHGAAFSSESGSQLIGRCPFCQKAEHFYVHRETSQWDCKRCSRSGNLRSFFWQIHERNLGTPDRARALRTLAERRGLLPETLEAFEVGWDGKQFTFPVYEGETLVDLRRYIPGGSTRASRGGKVGLFGGAALAEPDSAPVWLCEGEWDCMVLGEALAATGAAGAAVGAPGAGFKKGWLAWFQDRPVRLLFDADEAGEKADARAREALQGVARSVLSLHWPAGVSKGTDVRDKYIEMGGEPEALLAWLQDHLRGAPAGASDSDESEPGAPVPGASSGASAPTRWSAGRVIEEVQQWLYLPDPAPLYILFGAVLGNRLSGDPLWIFLVAPSGGSKSELITSLRPVPDVVCLSSLTPKALISGAHMPGGGDPSLLPRLDGKILAIKDFTAVLSLTQASRDEIFGVLRDAYDGYAQKSFGTGLRRSYEAQFGLIAGVTPAVELFRHMHATLGERFIRFSLDQRNHSRSKVVDQALRNLGRETEMRGALQRAAEHALATGEPDAAPPALPRDVREQIRGLAEWTGAIRTTVVRDKYRDTVKFRPTPEVGTRLAKQFAKLALGIAMFREAEEVGEFELALLRRAAQDTVPNRERGLVRDLFLHGGRTLHEMEEALHLPQATLLRVTENLKLLEIAQPVRRPRGGGSARWELTQRLRTLTEKAKLFERDVRWTRARKPKKRRRRR